MRAGPFRTGRGTRCAEPLTVAFGVGVLWCRGLGGLRQQPGADRGVDRGQVGAGQHPPQRRLRRERPDLPVTGPVTGHALVEHLQQRHRNIGDPPGDRGERPHPTQHHRRAQHQHHRDRVIPTLIVATIRHPNEPLQQVSVPQSGPGKIRAG